MSYTATFKGFDTTDNIIARLQTFCQQNPDAKFKTVSDDSYDEGQPRATCGIYTLTYESPETKTKIEQTFLYSDSVHDYVKDKNGNYVNSHISLMNMTGLYQSRRRKWRGPTRNQAPESSQFWSTMKPCNETATPSAEQVVEGLQNFLKNDAYRPGLFGTTTSNVVRNFLHRDYIDTVQNSSPSVN